MRDSAGKELKMPVSNAVLLYRIYTHLLEKSKEMLHALVDRIKVNSTGFKCRRSNDIAEKGQECPLKHTRRAHHQESQCIPVVIKGILR